MPPAVCVCVCLPACPAAFRVPHFISFHFISSHLISSHLISSIHPSIGPSGKKGKRYDSVCLSVLSIYPRMNTRSTHMIHTSYFIVFSQIHIMIMIIIIIHHHIIIITYYRHRFFLYCHQSFHHHHLNRRRRTATATATATNKQTNNVQKHEKVNEERSEKVK